MNNLRAFIIGTVALAGVIMAPARAAEEHVVLSPDQIQWGPAPSVLPLGAEAVVLYGDPTRRGSSDLSLNSRAAITSRHTGIRLWKTLL